MLLVAMFNTAQKMKFFIRDFFSKCDQICSFLWIWSHLLGKSLMENLIFCTMQLVYQVISKTLVTDKRIVTETLKKKSATYQKKKTL